MAIYQPHIDCGIDIGSTSLKIVLIDDTGKLLLTRAAPTPRILDEYGPVTNPIKLLDSIEKIIISGWREVGCQTPIRSITTAGVGEDGFCINANFEPMGNAIPWFDKRGSLEVQHFDQFKHLVQRTGALIDPTKTASKWLWLRKHKPEEINNHLFWVTLTDFPQIFWSKQPYISISLAPRTGCFDIRDKIWQSELISCAHAPSLPRIAKAGEIIGFMQSGSFINSGAVSKETILVAGGHDHPVGATAIRRIAPRCRVDSLGTANVIYSTIDQLDDEKLSNEFSYSIPPDGEGISCFGVIDFSHALNEKMEAKYPKEVITDNQLFNLLKNIEFGQDQSYSELIRRQQKLIEKLTFDAKYILKRMTELGVSDKEIFTTGGWSKLSSLIKLRASIYQQDIFVINDLELSAIGAANFGYFASTGKTISTINSSDILKVSPISEWVKYYRNIGYII